jgi:hypothetical protein
MISQVGVVTPTNRAILIMAPRKPPIAPAPRTQILGPAIAPHRPD